MARTLGAPNVQVNNNTVSIVPNSLKYKAGKGDVKVNPQSAGGDSVEMCISIDATTKKSSVSFSMYSTQTNIDLLDEWRNEAEGVTILVADGVFSKQFRQMYVIGDPDINMSSDGKLDITFEGKPVV